MTIPCNWFADDDSLEEFWNIENKTENNYWDKVQTQPDINTRDDHIVRKHNRQSLQRVSFCFLYFLFKSFMKELFYFYLCLFELDNDICL